MVVSNHHAFHNNLPTPPPPMHRKHQSNPTLNTNLTPTLSDLSAAHMRDV